VTASFSSETLEFLEKYYDLVHEASWLVIIYQVGVLKGLDVVYERRVQ